MFRLGKGYIFGCGFFLCRKLRIGKVKKSIFDNWQDRRWIKKKRSKRRNGGGHLCVFPPCPLPAYKLHYIQFVQSDLEKVKINIVYWICGLTNQWLFNYLFSTSNCNPIFPQITRKFFWWQIRKWYLLLWYIGCYHI